MTWRLTFRRSAEKEFLDLPSSARARVDAKLFALAMDPRSRGSLKLSGPDDLFRIRVGDYRVVYEIHDAERLLVVVRIRKRSEVYR